MWFPSHFSETLDGLTTIRAFTSQQRELARFFALKNRNTAVMYTCVCADHWVGQRIECVGTALVLGVSLLCILGKHFSLTWLNNSPAVASLAVMYAMGMTGVCSLFLIDIHSRLQLNVLPISQQTRAIG